MAAGPTLRPLGKKALQREHTRQALRRCALARFARHGFDRVSVAEIVADAGVTERTFYRHFPTKEAVLFEDFASRVGWFRAALAVRPRDEPLLDSVRIAAEAYPDDREVVRQVAQARRSLLSGRVVEEQLRRVQAEFAQAIDAHASERLPRSARSRLTAAVLGEAVAGALVSALRVWGEQDGRDTDALRRRTAEALDTLRALPSLVRAAGARLSRARSGSGRAPRR
jgi:AcrR family transcriptional regulator